MAILKPGFSPGLHGRKAPASWGRRVQYLGRDLESGERALLVGPADDLSKRQALELLGGDRAEYHETIVAYSALECRALEERFGGQQAAKEAIAHAVGERLSADLKPYVVAVHDKTLATGERAWHLHIALPGPAPERLLGPKGRAQQVVDAVWRQSAPRVPIQDWARHNQWQEIRQQLRAVQGEQDRLYAERRNALRRAPAARKHATDDRYAVAITALVERRHALELDGIAARYEARGLGGSVEHQVEVARAGLRRIQALSVIERRSEMVRARAHLMTHKDRVRRTARALDRVLGRGVAAIVRGATSNAAGAAVSITRTAAAETVQAVLPQSLRMVVTTGGMLTRVLSGPQRLLSQLDHSPATTLARTAVRAPSTVLGLASFAPTPAAPWLRAAATITRLASVPVQAVIRATESAQNR